MSEIQILNHLDKSIFANLESELKKVYLRINHSRKNSGVGRTQVFGMIQKRMACRVGPAVNNTLYPDLYNALLAVGKQIVPFEFDGIQLNQNYQCLKHIDRNNKYDSLIVSIGDYEGGELNIELSNGEVQKIDTKYKPVIFDGSKLWHWNDPITKGTKYSMVFFRNRHVQKNKDSSNLEQKE